MILKCKFSLRYSKKVTILLKKEIQNSEKTACQKVFAMVTSNLIDKDLLYQNVPR